MKVKIGACHFQAAFALAEDTCSCLSKTFAKIRMGSHENVQTTIVVKVKNLHLTRTLLVKPLTR